MVKFIALFTLYLHPLIKKIVRFHLLLTEIDGNSQLLETNRTEIYRFSSITSLLIGRNVSFSNLRKTTDCMK